MTEVVFARLDDVTGGPAGSPLPRVTTIASSATPTPDSSTTDEYHVTALAVGATFGAPTSVPAPGQKLILRVKDNGTPRALAFNSGAGGYRAGTDLALPTTTQLSKTIYIGFIYNDTDSKWDLVAIVDNI